MEQSIVRPTDKIMITVTRNLSHTKIMLVEETQVIRPLPEDPVNMTQIQASARIISNTGWDSVKSRIEQFGISKGRANMYKVKPPCSCNYDILLFFFGSEQQPFIKKIIVFVERSRSQTRVGNNILFLIARLSYKNVSLIHHKLYQICID